MFEQHLQCPYCKQAIKILLDLEIDGFNETVYDCEICSKPIEVDYYVENSKIISYSYNTTEGN